MEYWGTNESHILEVTNERSTVNKIDKWFGRPIAQYWEDVELWERVLNNFKGLKWIYELGTWQGGFSFYLYAQSQARGIPFYTFDLIKPVNYTVNWVQTDILKGRLGEPYDSIMKNEPGILFCDNGNKPKEVYLYSRNVHPECVIAVHDWGTEFHPQDIPEGYAACYSSSTTIFLAKKEFLMRVGKPAFTF